MFYKTDSIDNTRAAVVLTPSESKRLIARAIKTMPEIRAALNNGRIIIIGGTTNAYVAEEITGNKIDKFWYAAGRIAAGQLGANDAARRIGASVLRNGQIVNTAPSEMLMEFTADDVYIKGANAIDTSGSAGVLMSNDRGGTIGAAMGIIHARGSHLIVPAGLEKLIPSVAGAAAVCGQGRMKYATGDKVGMMPLINAKVVTEIQAIGILFGHENIRAVHIASGGVAGAEGAVTLVLEGRESSVTEAFDYIAKFKGEEAVRPG